MLRETQGREGRTGRTHLSSIAAALGGVLSGHAVESATAQESRALHGFSGWSSGGWH